jgi:hypothetical protein
MGKIGDNRLNQDERKAIRREIHKVVPWVMEKEKAEIELADAKKDFEAARNSQAGTEKMIATSEKVIVDTQARLATLRKLSAFEAEPSCRRPFGQAYFWVRVSPPSMATAPMLRDGHDFTAVPVALRLNQCTSCCPVSCTTRMPCRRVMRAIGQRATAAR